MAWTTTNDRLGTGVPGVIYDTQRNDIGALNSFRDPILGEGLFIFLPGVASTIVGSVVTYTTTAGAASPTGTTALWVGTTITGFPLAVATVANVLTTNWAWYQVVGAAVLATSGAVAAGDKVYWQANGVVSSTPVAGKQLVNAVAVSANGVPAANQATYNIAWPFAQGAIT
jgi:hypothetical protein